jgi:hypothetical protein
MPEQVIEGAVLEYDYDQVFDWRVGCYVRITATERRTGDSVLDIQWASAGDCYGQQRNGDRADEELRSA